MSMELVQPEITRVTMPISLNVLKFTTMKPQVCTYQIEYQNFRKLGCFWVLKLLD